MRNERKRLLLTGASGLLGAAILDGWAERWEITALVRRHRITRPGVENVPGDLAEPATLASLVERVRPHLMIHAAAWTDLDACESDPIRARTLHRDASGELARAAAKVGAGLIYISTDSLFAGLGPPHREDDPVSPQSVYARTKREGEEVSLSEHPAALVVRTCIVGWNAQPKMSLAEWLLRDLRAGRQVQGFTDVWFTPILTNALSDALARLVERQARGIVHVAGGECISKYDFALKLAEVFDLPRELVVPRSIVGVTMRAPRPAKPCLDSSLYARLTGDRPPSVLQTLRELRRLETNGWPLRVRSSIAA